MIFGPRTTIPAPPSPLARIIFDLTSAGVKPTPLAILCRATDQGLDDEAVSQIVDRLAAARDLEDTIAEDRP